MKNSKKTALLVLGMHRSGTSILARTLIQLGGVPPIDPMPPQQDNPDGFFESLGIVRLNNKMLSELGSSWDDARVPVSDDQCSTSWESVYSQWAVTHYLDEMKNAINDSFGKAALIVVKDPRMLLFHEAWIKALEETGYDVKSIFIHRFPVSVAHSLLKRNNIPLTKGIQLWARYNLCDFIAKNITQISFSFEEALQNPIRLVNLLLKFEASLDTAHANTAAKIWDAGRSHHSHKVLDVNDSLLSELFLKKIYVAFNEINNKFLSNPLLTQLYLLSLTSNDINKVNIKENKLSIEHKSDDSSLIKKKEIRTVIFHYHLFKNAGTSLDAAFKENFKGDEWVTKEFSGNPHKNRAEIIQWILDNPQAKCFSSHTALLPPPNVEGIKVLPVIFMRQPIDRILSAYAFEKKQGGDSFGAVLARNTTLAGYIETRLSLHHDRQCRNFHMARFATMFREEKGDEFSRAKMALEHLPFVGIVEKFSASLKILEEWLAVENFAGIKLKPMEKNVSRNANQTSNQRLANIKTEIGEKLYQKLEQENADDFALYKSAYKIFNTESIRESQYE